MNDRGWMAEETGAETIRVTGCRVALPPPQESRDRIAGYASLELNSALIIQDMKIVRGNAGRLFVSMPSRKLKNGNFKDVVFPANQATRDLIERAVLEEYRRVRGDAAPAAQPGRVTFSQERG